MDIESRMASNDKRSKGGIDMHIWRRIKSDLLVFAQINVAILLVTFLWFVFLFPGVATMEYENPWWLTAYIGMYCLYIIGCALNKKEGE